MLEQRRLLDPLHHRSIHDDRNSTMGCGPSRIAVDSRLKSNAAAAALKVEAPHFPNITTELLRVAVERASPTTTDIVNDGIIRFRPHLEKKEVDVYSSVIEVPGLGVMGAARIEKRTGEILTFQSVVRPSIIKTLFCQSSSDIAVDLLRHIDTDQVSDDRLLENIRTVVEISEDQGVFVDQYGNAVVFEVNRKSLDSGASIIAFRSGITLVQTRGLITCRTLLGNGSSFGFAFHATSISTFEALADAVGDHLKSGGHKISEAQVHLVRSRLFSLEYGDVNDESNFKKAALQFRANYLEPNIKIPIIDSSGCSMHIGRRRVVSSPIALLTMDV